jgi:hypothetical protein
MDANSNGEHVASLGQVAELPQDAEGHLALAGEGEGAPERAVHARTLGREMDGALESGRGLVEVLPLLLDQPSVQ